MGSKVSNSNTSSSEMGGRQHVGLFRYHAGQIQAGGWPVLLRKSWTFLKVLPLMLLAIPATLIVRALRPLVLIRFGPLLSTDAIGHFAGNIELYLCRRDAGMDTRQALDIFYYQHPVCNQQLKKMWDRQLHISRFARPMYLLNYIPPGGGNHVIPWPLHKARDIHGLMQRTPAHLSFTVEEERRGRQELQAMGIPEGTPFVCFHSRDSAYHASAPQKRNNRRENYRDSSIHNCVPAVEEMTRRGYFAIRMGAVVKEPLQTANPMIIDYATKYRSDFMDIFLGAKCYFYIGAQSGLDMIPMVFRRPVASLNIVPIQSALTWAPEHLFIPRKLWLREERRFLTFREIFGRQIDFIQHTAEYEQLGIEPVENTPEEITALAVEMDERLKKTWPTTKEDEELQRCFWSIFKPREDSHGIIASHIGAEFLRQNRALLD